MAEGSKQSFQFQSRLETAALLAELAADTTLGIPGAVQERLRDASLTVTTGQPRPDARRPAVLPSPIRSPPVGLNAAREFASQNRTRQRVGK